MTPTTADLRQEPESAHDGGGPRVLFFAPRVCWPLDTGAKLRNYHLARETARRGAVTFLSFADEGEGAGARGGGPEDFGGHVVTVPRERGYTPSKILRGALGRTPLPVLNYTTRAMAEALGRTLAREDFDVVQLESIHMAAYLPVIREARSRPSVVCDWHNVESELMRRYSEREPSLPRRLYARRTAGQLAALERRMLREFDAHVTVSERDRAQLLAAEPGARVFVVENGVDTAFYSDEQLARAHRAWLEGGRAAGAKPAGSGEVARSPDARRERVIFVGSMDYHANVEAVLYFGK
ncbi:MAG TPA: glycosyltransferase, partial [Pyrinomonadaceae bacterium]|nr:glycosyltransferase [Pyrinomonadaceae bacterium]